jgi:hypothetical protein
MVAGVTGCAHVPRVAEASEVRSLQLALMSLGPTVREEEAHCVARGAYDYSQILAVRYGTVRPALLHNFLVNSGFRKRGLCYEWARDLLGELQTCHVDSLELHWGVSRAGTSREHNSLVITALARPFQEGIVLDPWRRSGRLVWSPVCADKYPWVEGDLANSTIFVAP